MTMEREIPRTNNWFTSTSSDCSTDLEDFCCPGASPFLFVPVLTEPAFLLAGYKTRSLY